ncbi:hypothetical protein Pelo_14477 [Pelomyxa schiedti]|nr:hypothetical protein Pelo_14477 [Pelomyxa schiedti]
MLLLLSFLCLLLIVEVARWLPFLYNSDVRQPRHPEEKPTPCAGDLPLSSRSATERPHSKDKDANCGDSRVSAGIGKSDPVDAGGAGESESASGSAGFTQITPEHDKHIACGESTKASAAQDCGMLVNLDSNGESEGDPSRNQSVARTAQNDSSEECPSIVKDGDNDESEPPLSSGSAMNQCVVNEEQKSLASVARRNTDVPSAVPKTLDFTINREKTFNFLFGLMEQVYNPNAKKKRHWQDLVILLQSKGYRAEMDKIKYLFRRKENVGWKQKLLLRLKNKQSSPVERVASPGELESQETSEYYKDREDKDKTWTVFFERRNGEKLTSSSQKVKQKQLCDVLQTLAHNEGLENARKVVIVEGELPDQIDNPPSAVKDFNPPKRDALKYTQWKVLQTVFTTESPDHLATLSFAEKIVAVVLPKAPNLLCGVWISEKKEEYFAPNTPLVQHVANVVFNFRQSASPYSKRTVQQWYSLSEPFIYCVVTQALNQGTIEERVYVGKASGGFRGRWQNTTCQTTHHLWAMDKIAQAAKAGHDTAGGPSIPLSDLVFVTCGILAQIRFLKSLPGTNTVEKMPIAHSGVFLFVVEWVESKELLAHREDHWINILGGYGPLGLNDSKKNPKCFCAECCKSLADLVSSTTCTTGTPTFPSQTAPTPTSTPTAPKSNLDSVESCTSTSVSSPGISTTAPLSKS